MSSSPDHPSNASPFKGLALVLLGGVLLWFGVMLFEEFVTADVRWVLWISAAAIFALSAWLGRAGRGIWTPILLILPLAGLYGPIVLRDMPSFWPHLPLWIVCALAGWLSVRWSRVATLGASAVLAGLLMAYGGWYIPRLLADELTQYVDEPAPAFALQALDGQPYPMESLQGQIVVLDFFSTWCLPCVAELPEIESVQRALADRDDIVFLVVGDGAGGDSREQIAAFASEHHFELPFVYDPEGVAHDALGFWNVPALAVIDREGRVRFKHVGYNAAETGFRRRLTELLETL